MNKRVLSAVLGVLGLFLLVFSLRPSMPGNTITGNVIVDTTGVNTISKIIGICGIICMIASLLIENYELKHLKQRQKHKKISKNK